jgi:hypothetical protein
MKSVLIVLVMVGLIATALPALAEDGANVADQLGDIFSGKGNTYGGVEVIKDNLIGPLGVRVWGQALIGQIDDDVKRDIRGGLMLRVVL